MKYILTCSNGKQIDMSHYILEQMQGLITREDVVDRINYYKRTNLKYTVEITNVKTATIAPYYNILNRLLSHFSKVY
jgi:hypothetical protein